jgi:hypothetical protein
MYRGADGTRSIPSPMVLCEGLVKDSQIINIWLKNISNPAFETIPLHKLGPLNTTTTLKSTLRFARGATERGPEKVERGRRWGSAKVKRGH